MTPTAAAQSVRTVLIADLQILGAALCFGVCFIGQRAVSVDGLGPMTCNALRFFLSALFLSACAVALPARCVAVINGSGSSCEDERSEREREKEKIESERERDREREREGAMDEESGASIRLLSHSHTLSLSHTLTQANGSDSDRDDTRLLALTAPPHNALSQPGSLSPTHITHTTHLSHTTPDESSSSTQRSLSVSLFLSLCLSLRGACLSSLYTLCGGEATAARRWQSLRHSLPFWGAALGLLNFLGSGLQQISIVHTSASKVAFIAGFDLFLTPLMAMCLPGLPSHAPPAPSTWLSIALSLVGLSLLSGATPRDLSLGFGECVALLSTVFWTLHITYTDVASTHVMRALEMICVQMLCVGALSLCVAVCTEDVGGALAHLSRYLPWLLFLAVVEACGFLLMALGQTHAPPTHAALLLSLEGVFAAVAEFLVLRETLSFSELCGCLVMLAATLMAELGVPALDSPSNKAAVKSKSAWFEVFEDRGAGGGAAAAAASVVLRAARDAWQRVVLSVQRVTNTRVNQA